MPDNFNEPLQQVDRTSVLWRGRKFLYFAGCDYFRLASHPAILRAAAGAMTRYGLNVAASRRTTGNHLLYEQLEEATRRFFKSECALVVSNGYLTNLAVAQGLCGAFDQVLIDERAHCSLADVLPILGCKHRRFAHRDPADLARAIGAAPRSSMAILTDGMFAQDGSLAPLAAYRSVAPKALLWVDDAHAAGVFGRGGRGTVELEGIDRQNVIQTITFSKAFGAYGGAILCGQAHGSKIAARSSVLSGNTPLPLPLAAAALEALRLCRAKPLLKEKLAQNIALFWEEFGSPVPRVPRPIISVMARDPADLKARLLKARIYPPFIEYGAPRATRFFRFALSSEHSGAEIKRLARVLAASQKSHRNGDALLFLGGDV
jgi:7-keto-8-aminopelargonate synthetase-like enzyme